MMNTRFVFLMILAISMMLQNEAAADSSDWPEGGPKDIYVKATKKSPRHGIYEEGRKCLDCHRYDGVDAYTSATMAMIKSKKGRMAPDEIRQRVIDALNRHNNFREIFVLSTFLL